MNYLGWFGNLFLAAGLFGLGGKHRSSFLYTIVGESLWTVYSVYIGMWDIASICILFGGMALVNWWRWGKADEDSKTADTVASIREQMDSAELDAIAAWHRKYPGFNQPVVIPMCAAKTLLRMAERYRAGDPPSKTPCYAAEEEDVLEEFAQRITESMVHEYPWDKREE